MIKRRSGLISLSPATSPFRCRSRGRSTQLARTASVVRCCGRGRRSAWTVTPLPAWSPRPVGPALISKGISPHSLRHTYVTQFLDTGASVRDVQIGARHADPRITMRYDRARLQLDRHVNYVLAARVVGAI